MNRPRPQLAHGTSARPRGFTLLEISIALLVLALTITVAIPGLEAVTGARMRASAGKLGGEMRAMYSEAALSGRTCRLVFDLDERAYWPECARGEAHISSQKEEVREGRRYVDLHKEEEEAHRLEELAKDNPIRAQLEAKTPYQPMEGTQHVVLPDGVSFESVWVQHQAERYTAGDAYLYFFPQGFTEHAIIALKRSDDLISLESSALTGKVVLIDGKVEAPQVVNRGFTLLEVCVALAILAIGLVSVVDINAGAARLHEQSQHLTVGTLLAKAKMIDLEQKLNEDGFSDFDQQIDGNFEEQGHVEVRWHAEILKPDVAKANDQLTQLITGAMGGGAPGSPGGSSPTGDPSAVTGALSSFLNGSSLVPTGSALPSALAGLIPPAGGSGTDGPSGPVATGLGGLMGGAATTMIQAQVAQLVQLIQTGVREVRLTVTWPDGAREDNLSLATHFVILQPSGTGVSTGAPPGQGTASSSTPGAQPSALGGATPGSLVPPPLPGLPTPVGTGLGSSVVRQGN